MTARALRTIFQLKVTLKGFRPPIWRRFQISSANNLADLHIALQITMGWANCHLYEFIKGSQHYSTADAEGILATHDVTNVRLDKVLKNEKDSLLYVYDYGDAWEHEIVVEKILPYKTGIQLPVCLKGSRACPPEDVGGPPGYHFFLEAISDPTHRDYHDHLEWIGGEYDAQHFDLAAVNALLREY